MSLMGHMYKVMYKGIFLVNLPKTHHPALQGDVAQFDGYRRLQQGAKFTPNGTQVPDGPPPDVPLPPFPSSNSADISMLQGYEMLDFQPRGDSRWVPLSMREGQVFVPRPCGVRDDRADRLERELAELKLSLGQMKEVGWSKSACSQSVPPTSSADGFGPLGQELQGGGRELQGGGRDRAPGVGKEHVRDGVCHQGHVGVHHSPEPPDDKQYGRWRQEGGQNPMSLPWNEGVGNSKAELAELASNASPIELGDWLAVCGPVMRDLSSVSSTMVEPHAARGAVLL